MKIRKITPALGAEVLDVDLSRAPTEAQANALREAILAHGVLLIRDQRLSPSQLAVLSRAFGPIEPYGSTVGEFLMRDEPDVLVLSNIVENGKPVGIQDAGQYWHTDRSYVAEPAWSSLLYAVEVPVGEDGRVRGDTAFTSTVAAFDALPESRKAYLRTLRAVHRYVYRYTAEPKNRLPDAVHPVVLRHPYNGRESLYVNAGFTPAIEGMPAAESDALLAELFAHVAKPEFGFVHHWRVGDIIMWDNFATQHRATGDYGPPLRRLMWRTTVCRPAIAAT